MARSYAHVSARFREDHPGATSGEPVDQLTAPDLVLPGPRSRPLGGAWRAWYPPTVPDGGGLAECCRGDHYVRHYRYRQADQRGRARSSRRLPARHDLADSAARRSTGQRRDRPLAAPELPGTRCAPQRGAMRPSSYAARALGLGSVQSYRQHRTAGLGDHHQRGAHIPRDGPCRRPAVAALRPCTRRGLGLGPQPAAAGSGDLRRGHRERPGPAAGRCHQRAVGLVFPRQATRRSRARPVRKGRLGRHAVSHLDSSQARGRQQWRH
jgi:hypothetical protein